MPLVEQSSYQAPPFLKNGHLQTIIPYFFRKVQNVEFIRERVILPDGDFIDVDYSSVGANKALFLTHGLESSSDTHYIKGMARHFNALGIDVVAWNLRSCSGSLNWREQFYHAASYEDLDCVLRYVLKNKNYQSVHLAGFSLGASITANYLGRLAGNIPSQVEKAVLYSCPSDLYSSVTKMSKPSQYFYQQDFLLTMKQKLIDKNKIIDLSSIVDIRNLKRARDFITFDNMFTAPLHGFKNALHYYKDGSCGPYLENINVPTLIINAKNDPLLGSACYPTKAAKNNKFLFLETPKSGGHIGFISFGEQYWSETRAERFLFSDTLS